jgi:dTDP-glucose 4,6-dehydratase
LAQYPQFVNERVSFVKGDVRTFKCDSSQASDLFIHGATDVVTQARAFDVLDTCTAGTVNALSMANAMGVQRFLLISSGAVYGKVPDGHGAISESFTGVLNHLSAEAAYAQGKRNAEMLCALDALDNKMNISMARCFAMVGPHLPLDKHFAIGNFIEAALEKKPIVIKGDGTPLRSYLYMADVIGRLLLLLLAGRSGIAYNVGGKSPVSISGLARIVSDVLQSDQDIRLANQPVHGAHANAYFPDTRLIDNEFGLAPALSLQTAIEKTARWYAEQALK